MPRIHPLDISQADSSTAETLAAVRNKLKVLPNLFTTLAHAPVVLNSYLHFSDTLSHGRLTARQRELIAIAVAQENQCEYCLSAHATLGKGAGLGVGDIELARRGDAASETDNAILQLALAVLSQRGGIPDEALAKARLARLDDGLVLEVVGHVALNILTNYINRVADTDIDFPLLSLGSAT